MSLLERKLEIHKLHRKLLAQEQERLKAIAPAEAPKPSASAEQWRISNSDRCARLGGNTQTAIEAALALIIFGERLHSPKKIGSRS